MRDEDDGEIGDDVDLRLWGKSRGLGAGERYPLVCHLLDAGAAARYLWEHYVPAGVNQFIADGFGVTVDRAGHLITLWAALHDIGKLIPEFQALDPVDLPGYPATRGLRSGHDVASHHWLQATLPRLGYAAGDTDMPGFLVPQLLGGHHGRFHHGPQRKSGRVTLADGLFRDDTWERQRQATLAAVCRIVGDPGPPPEASLQAAVLTCAIVVLADWLVSQDTHLLSRMIRLPARGADSELRVHFEESQAVAARLAESAGLARLRLRPGDFSTSFPHIEKPNGLQQSVADRLPDLVHGPGLLLVTAPPGLGKTETAWYAAKVMGEVAGCPGLYMALPTTATADQIYLRIRDYVETRAESPAALMLLHGMAWLNTHYRPDTESAEVLTDDGHDANSFAPADWLLGRYRGMCGAWAVGTIDQALMAVLKTRFNALRLFGLAGKTVIVDEVHACDPYMQGLLLKLLRWLGSFGTPVVLLSATLTKSAAAALVSAYLEGAGIRRSRDSAERIMAPPYPGWLYADAATGATETATVTLSPARPLQVSIREISATPGPGESRPVPDRGPALRSELAPLTESGGCALVICTTVDEAQQTYLQLQDWFSDLSGSGTRPPELELLHARFPAWQREQITGRVIARFGKDAGKGGNAPRPRAAVLVATAIVEQSLDLDFDLIVSDLAPVALLLQRAGRCWRHDKHGIWRPSWASGPHLTVLVPPGGPKSPKLFGSWAAIYDESLLANTCQLLADRSQVSIPDDVQPLVDAVYDDERFATGDLSKAALARIGSEIALGQLASDITIPGPRAVNSLDQLTEDVVDPDLLVTRFDADSVRVLPVFTAGDGHLWLDRACEIAVPGQDTAPDRDDCRTIINHTVPVRGGPWLRGHDSRSALPKQWRRNVHLRDLVLLPHTRAPDGSIMPAAIGDREFLLDDVLGLRASRAT